VKSVHELGGAKLARRCAQQHKRMKITTQEDSNNNARKLKNI
jgi:hypothetical protein